MNKKNFICSKENLNLVSAQIAVGGVCWSASSGVAAGGCSSGTQCGPWLPNGGVWDGSASWYCVRNPALTTGASCDYSVKVLL